MHTTTPTVVKEDFWLLCSTVNDKTLAYVAAAFDYLPSYFKLLVPSETASQLHQDSRLIDRVRIEPETEQTNTSAPFFNARAIISDQAADSDTDLPSVIVSDHTDQDLKETDELDYLVSTNNPAALASAILRIQHAVAA